MSSIYISGPFISHTVGESRFSLQSRSVTVSVVGTNVFFYCSLLAQLISPLGYLHREREEMERKKREKEARELEGR